MKFTGGKDYRRTPNRAAGRAGGILRDIRFEGTAGRGNGGRPGALSGARLTAPAGPPALRSAGDGQDVWRPVWRRARYAADRVAICVIDVVVSSAVLVLMSPVIAVIAVMVRLDAPGPVVFRHCRVGLNRRRGDGVGWSGVERRSQKGYGRPFTLYKFRTMYSDARARFPEFYVYKYSDEELVTLPIKVLVSSKRDVELIEGASEPPDEQLADPRVTRVGSWLRRTSLDELPNFWNVLKGDMHLVGPRPDIAENIRYYTDRHLQKLDVKPGITGLPQVSGRGMLTFHEINELDIEYVERRSLLRDLHILFKTVRVVLSGVDAA